MAHSYGELRAMLEKMLKNYGHLFGSQPKKYSAPLDKDDSPELNQTDLMDDEQHTIYQSLIGALKWCVTLGRFDIAVAVMTMSSFRVAPREGHLDRLKQIYVYLRKHPDGAIRFRTGIPPCEEMYTMPDYEWMHTVYGDCEEEVSPDLPQPKEKYTWLLGDNKSVITSSTIPHSSLSKRHQALAYHRVRSAVAAKLGLGFLKFSHIDGKQNPADIMTKFLPYPVFCPLCSHAVLEG